MANPGPELRNLRVGALTMADPRLPRARGPHCLRERAVASGAMNGPKLPAPTARKAQMVNR